MLGTEYTARPRRQWFMHSSLCVLTTVTHCSLASLTICSGIFRPYKTLQHVLLLVLDVVSTSRRHACLEATSLAASVQHIEFHLAVLVYKVLNGLSPQYLVDDCQLITTTGCQRLRSSNVTTCQVPRTHTSLGNCSFTVAGLCLWDNLPLHQRDSEVTLLEFCWLLKTHLYAYVLLRTAAPSDFCF